MGQQRIYAKRDRCHGRCKGCNCNREAAESPTESRVGINDTTAACTDLLDQIDDALAVIDDVLEAIDDALEVVEAETQTSAEDFVAAYIQRGGE